MWWRCKAFTKAEWNAMGRWVPATATAAPPRRVALTGRRLSWGRLNHFPNTGSICKKDGLARAMRRMTLNYGRLFDFVPRTFILPTDLDDFLRHTRTLQRPECGLRLGAACQSSRRRQHMDLQAVGRRAGCGDAGGVARGGRSPPVPSRQAAACTSSPTPATWPLGAARCCSST